MNGTILSDKIEQFILDLLDKQSSDELLVKRKDIASQLACAPSQVTYVINTRFTPDARFIVESRRGSNGFIRIALRPMQPRQLPAYHETVENHQETRDAPGGKRVNPNSIEAIEKSLEGYFHMLLDYDIVSEREYRLICNTTHTMLEYCPESYRKEAVKTMIHRIEWALKGE